MLHVSEADFFAAAALTGLLSHPDAQLLITPDSSADDMERVAISAHLIAKAMIKMRL